MYNVSGRDALQLNERCMTFILCHYYPVICIQLFQSCPQAPCQKEIAAEGTALQPRLRHTLKGFSSFSPDIRAKFCKPRAELHSSPS